MEIMEVVRRHDITRGMSPEKLCAIIEELGPTFIKLGQILSMRSDFLPKEYCEALKKLRSDVSPMSYAQVVAIVEASYGRPLGEVFSSFDEQALGSASIAQVHAAVLQSGEPVVVKVQREGIHDVMSRDIMLLKQGLSAAEVHARERTGGLQPRAGRDVAGGAGGDGFPDRGRQSGALSQAERGRGFRHFPGALP